MPRPQKGERTPGSGRAPGTPNKLTRKLKAVLSEVLEDHETELRLRELRDSEEAADRATFWRLAGRLVPNAVEAEIRGTMVSLVDLSDQRKDDDGLAEG